MKGLATIAIAYLIVYISDMTVIRSLMEGLFSVLLIAIIIMFQPDLQRLIENMGTKNVANTVSQFFKKQHVQDAWLTKEQIEEIAVACEDMSKVKTGALIVIERNIPLKEYIRSGITLKAEISSQLLINIFEKNTPLHDGAVIIRNNWIQSATCYLPLTNSTTVDKHLGTRHRAALGASESTDCIVIVVSEETGAMSVCESGKIHRNVDKTQMIKLLSELTEKKSELVTKTNKKTLPWPVKLIAPVVGVLSCIMMINNNDPVIQRTFNNIPVHLVNEDALSNINQSYTVESGDSISVVVKGHRTVLDGMLDSDIYATADLEEMSLTYAVPVNIQLSENYTEKVEIQPAIHTLKLALEDLTQIELPIEINVVGANVNKLMTVETVNAPTLQVTGAESVIKTLDKAVVSVDITEKTTDFTETVSATIYDKNGALVPMTKLKLNNQIDIKGIAHKIKDVPLKVSLVEQDKVNDYYYELNSCELETNTVKIAATAEVIDTVETINLTINPDDNAEVVSTLVFKLKNYLPEGVVLAPEQEEEISVSVNITRYQKVVLPLTNEDILISGTYPDDYEAQITAINGQLTFFVNTSKIAASDVSLSMLNPYILVNNIKTPGQYTAELKTDRVDGISIESSVVVTYEIIEKEGD